MRLCIFLSRMRGLLDFFNTLWFFYDNFISEVLRIHCASCPFYLIIHMQETSAELSDLELTRNLRLLNVIFLKRPMCPTFYFFTPHRKTFLIP